jgi:hypothetical protein
MVLGNMLLLFSLYNGGVDPFLSLVEVIFLSAVDCGVQSGPSCATDPEDAKEVSIHSYYMLVELEV